MRLIVVKGDPSKPTLAEADMLRTAAKAKHQAKVLHSNYYIVQYTFDILLYYVFRSSICYVLAYAMR
jgi:hypothetical protein